MSISGQAFKQFALRKTYVALGLTSYLLGLSTSLQAQEVLTHHLYPAVINEEATLLAPMIKTKTLRLDLVLALRDQKGLDDLLQQLYNSHSPLFRKFLTVSEFTDRFGPSQEDYNTLIDFVTAHGFKVVGGSREGMDLQIEGSIASIEKTFNISMQTYHDPKNNRTFYAPNREPTTDLPFALWHISGLDNYSIPHPLYTRSPQKLNQAPSTNTGSGPAGSYLGSDMRAAYYGVNDATALTGAGQNLGLFEFYGVNLNDLSAYYKAIGQTNTVPIKLLSTDGTSIRCMHPGCDDSEQILDMTQALGMAPGLESLILYIGNTDTSIYSAMVSHNPLPSTISCSWGWTTVDARTLEPYYQRMAAQGQTFFAASGDDSTWGRGQNEAWPADSPYVVAVGGTDLITSGPAGSWESETAWVHSGGGVSPDRIPIPSWQQLAGVITAENKGSTTWRNGPDVAANANNTFFVCANQKRCTANVFGGTSFAAPMWAAYVALANQQRASENKPPLGYINNFLYSLGVSSSYLMNFNDVTSGTSGSYSAVAGFDLVTGWGSMKNGGGLIQQLAQ